MRSLALLLTLASVAAAPAMAQAVREVRAGVLGHNICALSCDNSGKEDGPDINGEVVFASPSWLGFAGAPRPYLVASVNTAGDTSYAGAGFNWNWEFAQGWSIEPGLGIIVHDGELDFPFPQGDPRNDPVSAEKVFLGSRDVFRTSLALNRDFGERWGAQLVFEHLSHGQILGNGRNQGMDNAGVRIIYRLGE